MKDILTEIPPSDIWEKLPQWFLIIAVMILLPMAAYTVSHHVKIDDQQSADLKSLADTVSNLTVVVEYNYKETQKNAAKMESNTTLIHETQNRLERIMGRIEARLDEEDN